MRKLVIALVVALAVFTLLRDLPSATAEASTAQADIDRGLPTGK